MNTTPTPSPEKKNRKYFMNWVYTKSHNRTERSLVYTTPTFIQETKMTAKDTFCRLITKTPANGNSVSSGGQTGFGAPASKRETRETRERKKDKKKICLLCRLGLRQGWLGWAIFSWVFRPSQKAAKKEEVFSAGLTSPPPTPTLTFLHFPTRPSCTQHLATPFFFFGYWEQT